MPTSSMDWGHHRWDAHGSTGCLRPRSAGHVVVMPLTPVFGWPRCRRPTYASVWSAAWVLGVSCRSGGVVGWVGVRWWIGVGVVEMEGGLQVSGGVETVIKARYETQLSSCLISRGTTWASHFLGPPWCFAPGSLRRAMSKWPTSLW